MRVVYSLSDARLDVESVVTIGAFDGVHRGHRVVIDSVRRAAAGHGRASVVVTFFPHPSIVLGHAEPFYLTSTEEKIAVLDAAGIDLLVVTPRWATLEFDMPIRQWRQMLGTSEVTLAGGLEIRYQPYPGGPASIVTLELATGAAVSVLSQGADAVYLFNFFQDPALGRPLDVYQKTLKAMASLDSLLKQPRSIGVTYRDITAPGEEYRAPLPATGKEAVFPMRLGPIPENRWLCELLVGVASSQATPTPVVWVNGNACEVRNDDTTTDGLRLISFSVPATALAGTEVHQIKAASTGQNALTIQRLEMSLRVPGGEHGGAP